MQPLPHADLIAHLRLVRTEGVGPVTYRRLLDRYRTPAAALDALPRLARNGGRSRPPVIPSTQAVEAEVAATEKAGATMVFHGQADYPELLALLDDAPPCLILLGDPALVSSRCVAAVGGRNASINGQRMAESLAADLASHVTVVSGLARGIDTAAHTGAMRTGRTIAVIAGGIDVAYPPENAALQRRIGQEHLIVTEAPVGTEPQARHFPRRNRIIAGLSLGVIVVEAAPKSGSLITARIAQEQGREVFAVPGSPLDPRARGGNDLIRQGAVLVENAADVLENMPFSPRDFAGRSSMLAEPDDPGTYVPPPPQMPGNAQQDVLSCLSGDPTMVDDLVRRCQLSPSITMAVLLELELAGRVETLSGNRVARLPDAFT
jgi:DNA processing protein